MTDYKPGDVVTLEHDDGSRLVREVEGAGFVRGVEGSKNYNFDYLWTLGWRVTDHKPKIELPESTGPYLDSRGDVWVLESGGWVWDGSPQTPKAAESVAPFTRLVPEGSEREAAIREVIDWQRAQLWSDVGDSGDSLVLDGTRKHFGITQ